MGLNGVFLAFRHREINPAISLGNIFVVACGTGSAAHSIISNLSIPLNAYTRNHVICIKYRTNSYLYIPPCMYAQLCHHGHIERVATPKIKAEKGGGKMNKGRWQKREGTHGGTSPRRLSNQIGKKVLDVCESQVRESPRGGHWRGTVARRERCGYCAIPLPRRHCKRPDTHLNAYITFASFGMGNKKDYSWNSRACLASSGNKAFQPSKGGCSIFGYCLDGRGFI